MRFRLLLIGSLLIWSLTSVFGQEIIWQQEYQAQYEGMNTCAYSGGFSYARPTFVDVDNDGDMDCFVGYSDQNGLYYIRNDGTASSPAWTMISRNFFDFMSHNTAPTFADIDGDGDADAFIGDIYGKIRFIRNTGTAGSPSWEVVTESFESWDFGSTVSPTFCDTDNDGDLDFFVGNSDGVVQYYRNDGTATAHSFVKADTAFAFGLDGSYAYPVFCDIDNDGDQDLFVGSWSQIYYYRNDGTAAAGNWSLTAEKYEGISTDVYAFLAFVDLDGDMDFDIVTGESLRGLTYFQNVGTASDATWDRVTRHYMSIDVQYPCFPTFCDIDNDGDHDLFVGRYYNDIYMLTNIGTAAVPAWELTETEYLVTRNIPAFCDIDDDGDFDLFIGTNDGTLEYYENEGTAASPSWAAVVEPYGGIDFTDGYCSPAFGDLDNDGDLDLVLGEENGELYYCENTGSAGSAAWATPDPDWFNPDLTWWERLMPALCDIDQDGDLDLFIGCDRDQVAFFRNEGTASVPNFVLVSDAYMDDYAEDQTRPAFCDIDNDGDPDMFIGIDAGGMLFWRNMGVTGVDDESGDFVPGVFSLEQNFPNPFNPQTAITFHVKETCRVLLKVFDLQGREITTLTNDMYPAGKHRVLFDGQGLPTGIYFYQIRMRDFQEMRKMILTK